MDNLQRCPNCGFRLEPGDKACRNCGQPFENRREEALPSPPPPPLTPPTPPTPPPPPGIQATLPPSEEPKYVAWEDREHIGFFEALWKTWVDSVFTHDKFFSRLPYKGGLGSPILYALIILWLTTIVSSIYNLIFANYWLGVVRNLISSAGEFGDFGGMMTGFTLFSFIIKIIVAPAFILIGLFIISGIYHLITMIFGWNKRDFEATLRAVAYGVGPAIFSIVPFCGSIVGWIWALVLTIIGIKHMQQTSGGKAAFVVLLPLIFCCCLIFLLALVFGTAILALIKGAAHSGYNF